MGMDECGCDGEACLCVDMGVCSVGTCTWIWVSVHVHVLTAKSLHSISGKKVKEGPKEDLCDQATTLEDECIITEIDKPEQPLSRIELRQLKLESREKVSLKRMEEVRSGEWLKDYHIKPASDLLKVHFPSVSGLYNPILGADLSFLVTQTPFVQMLHTGGSHWLTIKGEHLLLKSTTVCAIQCLQPHNCRLLP